MPDGTERLLHHDVALPERTTVLSRTTTDGSAEGTERFAIAKRINTVPTELQRVITELHSFAHKTISFIVETRCFASTQITT